MSFVERVALTAAVLVTAAVGCGGLVVVDGQGAGGNGAQTTGAVTAGPATGTAVSTGASMTTGGVTTGTGGSPECVAYCNSIMTHCTGDLVQYASNDACLGVCGTLAFGSPGDTSGNSVGCRGYHAGAAEGTPEVHCVHAGPYGAGVCGEPCDSFCTIALQSCTGGNSVYIDQAACLGACKGFADFGSYAATVTVGNTLACRLSHLTLATLDPAAQCPNIAASSPGCQ